MHNYIEVKKPFYQSKVLLIWGAGILFSVFVLVSIFLLSNKSNAIDQHIKSTLVVRDVEKFTPITGLGTIVSQSERIIVAPEEGLLEQLFLQRGESVQKGQTLAIITSPALIRETKNAEFLLNDAVASAALLKGELDKQLIMLQARLLNAEADSKAQSLELEALEKLESLGTVSKIVFKQQQLHAERAELEVENINKQIKEFKKNYSEQLAASKLKVQSAQEQLAYYKSRVELLTVVADRNGIVKDLNLRLGQSIKQGQELMSVVGTDMLYGEVKVAQYAAVDIDIGNAVTVRFHGAQELRGTVDFIDPIARNGASMVRIKFEDQAHGLMIDQSIEASIAQSTPNMVSLINKPQHYDSAFNWTVYVKEGNKMIRTDVRLLPEGLKELKLEPALKDGQLVALIPEHLATKDAFKY